LPGRKKKAGGGRARYEKELKKNFEIFQKDHHQENDTQKGKLVVNEETRRVKASSTKRGTWKKSLEETFLDKGGPRKQLSACGAGAENFVKRRKKNAARIQGGAKGPYVRKDSIYWKGS